MFVSGEGWTAFVAVLFAGFMDRIFKQSQVTDVEWNQAMNRRCVCSNADLFLVCFSAERAESEALKLSVNRHSSLHLWPPAVGCEQIEMKAEIRSFRRWVVWVFLRDEAWSTDIWEELEWFLLLRRAASWGGSDTWRVWVLQAFAIRRNSHGGPQTR